MKKSVTILGSTGSVGQSTVDVIASAPARFEVAALTAHTNAALLAQQAVRLKAKLAVIADESRYAGLKDILAGTGIAVAAGPEGLLQAAQAPADTVMAAIVGFAGLPPLLAALERGACVAIANKEPLAAAGPFVLEAARRGGATILPVDSEHNAIFQVFDRDRPEGISRIILTASGGPFRSWSAERMAAATPAQAVAHPNWSMGAKISVDSATMMNKALELIEAHHLFAMPPEKIDVLVHPQSVIHSMVEYLDGSVLAQLGAPDMRTPIAYALAFPERMATPGQRLDFSALSDLTFETLDEERFPAISLARECLAHGLGACVALNAANEVAVAAFLTNRIGFSDIMEIIRIMLDRTGGQSLQSVRDVMAWDAAVRNLTDSLIKDHISKSRRVVAQ